MTDKMQAIIEKIRETPLPERLEMAQRMVGRMCAEGRPPKMSVPVHPTDEDVFICQTSRDALEYYKQSISTGYTSTGMKANRMKPVTLEEFIRSRLASRLEGEFLFDAWLEDGRLHICFIHEDDEVEFCRFVVDGNAVMHFVSNDLSAPSAGVQSTVL